MPPDFQMAKEVSDVPSGSKHHVERPAVASAQWMKAWGWKSWYPRTERVMWEEITGLGVHMRVYRRQGCDSLAQCEGLGVDVWVLGHV